MTMDTLSKNKYFLQAIDSGCDKNDTTCLINFGINNLPDQFIIDTELGQYFFLISETDKISKEIRDFCIDVSLYCQDSYSTLYSKEKINKAFNCLNI